MKDKEEESNTADPLQVEVAPVAELAKAHSSTPAIPVGDMEETLDELASEVDRKEEKARKTWTVKRPPVWMWVTVAGAVFIGVLLFGVLSGIQGEGPLAWLATETPTATTLPTATITSTATLTSTSTTVPIATFTLTPTLAVSTNPVDGAVLSNIPAGEFETGSGNYGTNERPIHPVYLDAFWMYQTEVTNQLYAKCVEDGNCELPRCSYYGEEEYLDHPVVCVSWHDAKSYCEWAEGDLPTEAEWEKAARGGLEGRKYPWGNENPICQRGAENGAQYSSCEGRTVPVGNFAPNGYGLYDMAGNVWEWVSDWYGSGYYPNSPEANPTGPESGTYRVLRGGSWHFLQSRLRSASRSWDNPVDARYNLGFRCVLSPQP